MSKHVQAVAVRLAFASAFALLLAAGPRSAIASAGPAPEAVPPVVSGAWLEQRLGSPDLVLLDARPLRDFLGAHLPGARSLTPDNLRGTSGGVPAAIHPPELLGAIFARAGVARGSWVVAYGAESDVDATYVATA